MVDVAMSKRATPITDEIETWLEWAGQRLLSLGTSSPKPKGYKTNWPDYVPDTRAYGYSPERLRPAKVPSAEIALMDELLLLPQLVHDITARRVVNARSLVTPVSGRYLYSWSRLSFMLHLDRRTVVRMHYNGLCEIGRNVPAEKIYLIRQKLSTPVSCP